MRLFSFIAALGALALCAIGAAVARVAEVFEQVFPPDARRILISGNPRSIFETRRLGLA